MRNFLIEVEVLFGKKVYLSKEIFVEICRKHPEIITQFEKMKEVLRSPQMVRRSKYDPKVLLFYKLFKGTPVSEKYLMVAVSMSNLEGYVVTSYFTDRVKMGEEIWREG